MKFEKKINNILIYRKYIVLLMFKIMRCFVRYLFLVIGILSKVFIGYLIGLFFYVVII